MKNAILLMLLAALSVSAYAQSDSTTITMKDIVPYQNAGSWFKDLEDGYIMKHRTMLTIKNGISMTMDKDITLSNGTVVKNSGSYTEIGGKKIFIKEGDFIDLQGAYFPMKQY